MTMLKFMRKSKGFISIFLCLVLLPMVTFSTLVIDVSRLQNARTLVTSAGDLAMNAGMSEYNKTLQEMYGIFATSTSDEELEKALQNYFSKTVSGSIGTSNLSEEDYIQKYASQLSHWLVTAGQYEDMDFSNFIEMELDAAGSFKYMGVDNSSPANPAVLKQQIVDYMKYKGPVSLSLNLFNKIGVLKDSKKQVEVVEKKVDYAQALDDLQGPCEDAFKAVYGKEVGKDSSKSNYGYNDYVVDFNNDYLASGKDFEKGLLKGSNASDSSTAYNNIRDNLQKMSEFLYYDTIARIAIGDIDLPSGASGYNMRYLDGGLTYDDFDGVITSDSTKNSKKFKYDSVSNMTACSKAFDEFIGKFEIKKDKKKQDLTFEDQNIEFIKYFKKGTAKIEKIDTDELSEYVYEGDNKQKLSLTYNTMNLNVKKYVSKADYKKDSAKLEEDEKNVSTKLLDEWEPIVGKVSKTADYNALSEHDGKVFDLVLQELDKNKKAESIVNFILYSHMISALNGHFDNNWKAYEKDIKAEIETAKEYLKGVYDYANTTDGSILLTQIENQKTEKAKYEGGTGYIKVKETAIENTKSDIAQTETDIKNKEIEIKKEPSNSKKLPGLKKDLQNLKTDLENLKGDLSQFEADLVQLNTNYNGIISDIATKELTYNGVVAQRNKAAELDAEIIVKAKENYYEYQLKTKIIADYAKQVEKLDERLREKILPNLNGSVIEFKDHGRQFLDNALKQLDGIYDTTNNCYTTAENCVKKLEVVKQNYGNVQTAYTNWQNSAGQVSDPTTRSTMQSDADNTSSGLKERDIDLAIAVAGRRKGYFRDLRDILEGVEFFNGISLVNSTSKDKFLDATYKSIAKNIGNGGYGDLAPADRKSENIKGQDKKSGDITDKNLLAKKKNTKLKCDAFNWNPQTVAIYDDINEEDGVTFYKIKYGDELDGNKHNTVENIQPYDLEKFFKVLIVLVTPKENNNPADQQKVEKIKKVKEDAVSDAPPTGKVTKEVTTVSDKINVKEDVVKEAQQRIDEYGENGGTNEPNNKSAGDERKDFTMTDNKDDYKNCTSGAKDSLNQSSGLLGDLANLGTNLLQDAYLEEYFTEMFTCQTDVLAKNKDNKMLNGCSIDGMYKKDTAWYGGEMEYIIWGGDSVSGAKVKNEVAIFGIRFALNLIYAFTAADIQEFTQSAASVISCGFLLIQPVINIVLTIGLAAAESAIDLIKLKNGEDVQVYKSAQTFICSPMGALQEGAKTIANYAIEQGVSAVQQALDDKVDEIHEFGNEKLKYHMDKVEELRDKYIDEASENVTSTVKDMIVTPLFNALSPVFALRDAAVDTFEDDLSEAFDKAVENIRSSIESVGDGPVKEVGLLVLNEFAANCKSDVLTLVETAGSAQQIKGIIEGKVNDCMTVASGTLKTWMDDAGQAFMDKATDCGDVACNKIKELSSQWTTKAGEKLSSTLSSGIDKKLSDENLSIYTDKLKLTKKADKGGAGGGLTLNYKEYCKIFVLIGLLNNDNEASMLKRCAALIEANVKNPGDSFDEDEDFQIVDVNTVVAVEAKVKLGTLFPWGVEVSENGATNTTSLGFQHLGSNTVTIDYKGVNAY